MRGVRLGNRARGLEFVHDPRRDDRRVVDLLLAEQGDGHLSVAAGPALRLLLRERIHVHGLVRHLVQVEQRLDLVAKGTDGVLVHANWADGGTGADGGGRRRG